jgi:hypothetical protein
LILRFENLVDHIEKETIILKISEYLNFFEKRGTSYCLPLVKIFINNGDEIFGQFCTQILGFYCQRGYDLYTSNEKKYQKYSVKDKVKNNSEISNNLNSIIENCKDLINRLKAESIQKYCKSFSTTHLIDENEFTTLEEKLDILDSKRIRAVCEDEVRDERTGETWLDYYNAQVYDLRIELKSLEAQI